MFVIELKIANARYIRVLPHLYVLYSPPVLSTKLNDGVVRSFPNDLIHISCCYHPVAGGGFLMSNINSLNSGNQVGLVALF